MSRNKEKAQSALNRFQTYKNQQAGVLESNPQLRPKYVQLVESLPQAEKWRTVVLSEISIRLTRIQDPTISDFLVRELNEELNKLFREKRAWEYHVKSLGGNDYLLQGNLNATGILVPNDPLGVKGYRYFGRAKELPDVKRLLEADANAKSGKRNEKLVKLSKDAKNKEREANLDLSYYGFNDEVRRDLELFSSEDVDLIHLVGSALNEKVVIENEDPGDTTDEDELLEYERRIGIELLQKVKAEPKGEELEEIPDCSVIPSHKAVSKWLVDRKKRELLDKLGM